MEIRGAAFVGAVRARFAPGSRLVRAWSAPGSHRNRRDSARSDCGKQWGQQWGYASRSLAARGRADFLPGAGRPLGGGRSPPPHPQLRNFGDPIHLHRTEPPCGPPGVRHTLCPNDHPSQLVPRDTRTPARPRQGPSPVTHHQPCAQPHPAAGAAPAPRALPQEPSRTRHMFVPPPGSRDASPRRARAGRSMRDGVAGRPLLSRTQVGSEPSKSGILMEAADRARNDFGSPRIGLGSPRITSDRARITSDRSRITSDHLGPVSDHLGSPRIGLGSPRVTSDRARIASDRSRITSDRSRIIWDKTRADPESH